VHIPDDLDDRVINQTTADDSYSGIVQEALEEWLERREAFENTTDA
jgi:hypothetical protein